jgi:predicted dehydrogenase
MAGVHAAAAGDAGLRVVAVASATGSSARHLAGELDARRVSAADLPAGADVLVVATPPTAHADATLAGLAAGATVLVESPIAATLSDTDRMVTAAGRSTGRLRATANLRCSPAWRTALDRIAQLGPLGHLSASVTQPTPDWGHLRDPLQAGGVLFTSGAQLLPLLLDAAGAGAAHRGVARVDAVAATLESSRNDGADDRAEVTLRLRTGGTDADLTATLHAEWGPGASTWVQAAGELGAVRIEFAPSITVEHNGERVPTSAATTSPLHQLGYVAQLAELGTDADATLDVDAAVHVLDAVTAAYRSAGRHGEWIDLSEPVERDRTPMQWWRTT